MDESTQITKEITEKLTQFSGAESAFDDMLLVLDKQVYEATKELATAPAQAREFWQGVLFAAQKQQTAVWRNKNRLNEARLNLTKQLHAVEASSSSSASPQKT